MISFIMAQALFINESIHSLGDLSSKVDKEFAEKINSLNSHLYRDNSQPWQCNNLFYLCVKFTEKIKTQSKTKKDNSQLEGLYK